MNRNIETTTNKLWKCWIYEKKYDSEKVWKNTLKVKLLWNVEIMGIKWESGVNACPFAVLRRCVRLVILTQNTNCLILNSCGKSAASADFHSCFCLLKQLICSVFPGKRQIEQQVAINWNTKLLTDWLPLIYVNTLQTLKTNSFPLTAILDRRHSGWCRVRALQQVYETQPAARGARDALASTPAALKLLINGVKRLKDE